MTHTTTSPHATCPRAAAVLERMRRLNPRCDPLKHLPDVHPERIPRHIAIIMDGNGRWAQERGFPRIFGHRNGAAAVRDVVEQCGRLGVEALTLYSFSLENWKRPDDEVAALMYMAVAYCEGEKEALRREGIRFRVIGRRAGLPREVIDAIESVENHTRDVVGPTLCLALNYGSRQEIVDAAKSLARDAAAGRLDPDTIDEAAFSSRLYAPDLPDPDLLIRTGGDLRVSNFLLWQISYAELVVTPTYWPDFRGAQLSAAVREYASRARRFGGLESDGVNEPRA
jgi:undecaprenyl diphosphate synthase